MCARDHTHLCRTNICPDRCWKCSDQPGRRPWRPFQSSRHPSISAVLLSCKWGTKRSHCIIQFPHLIFSSERKSGTFPLMGWRHQPPLCPVPLCVLSRCRTPALSSLTSPDWEVRPHGNLYTNQTTSTTSLVNLSSCGWMRREGRIVSSESHSAGSVTFSPTTRPTSQLIGKQEVPI